MLQTDHGFEPGYIELIEMTGAREPHAVTETRSTKRGLSLFVVLGLTASLLVAVSDEQPARAQTGALEPRAWHGTITAEATHVEGCSSPCDITFRNVEYRHSATYVLAPDAYSGIDEVYNAAANYSMSIVGTDRYDIDVDRTCFVEWSLRGGGSGPAEVELHHRWGEDTVPQVQFWPRPIFTDYQYDYYRDSCGSPPPSAQLGVQPLPGVVEPVWVTPVPTTGSNGTSYVLNGTYTMQGDYPDVAWRDDVTWTFDLRCEAPCDDAVQGNCRYVSTSAVAANAVEGAVPEQWPQWLRFNWEDIHYCWDQGTVRIMSTGTRDGTWVNNGSEDAAMATILEDILGFKFKYAGSDPVMVDRLADGSLQAIAKGGFEMCVQIPLLSAVIRKGLIKVAKLVPDRIRTKLEEWGKRKIFRSSLIPDWVKNKIIRAGIRIYKNSIDGTVDPRIAEDAKFVVFMVETLMDKVGEKLVKLVLGDGVCRIAPWEPEIVGRFYPDGTHDPFFDQGSSGPFTVYMDF